MACGVLFVVIQIKRMSESGMQRARGSASDAMKLLWMKKGSQAKLFDATSVVGS